jgi:hypothetical protein
MMKAKYALGLILACSALSAQAKVAPTGLTLRFDPLNETITCSIGSNLCMEPIEDRQQPSPEALSNFEEAVRKHREEIERQEANMKRYMMMRPDDFRNVIRKLGLSAI